MNTKDTNRYRMITSVRATLADHEKNNSWTKIPALPVAGDEAKSLAGSVAGHTATVPLRRSQTGIPRQTGLCLVS